MRNEIFMLQTIAVSGTLFAVVLDIVIWEARRALVGGATMEARRVVEQFADRSV